MSDYRFSMPQTAALDALLSAYREEISWLMQRASEYEGKNDLVAADYVHRAKNLEAIIQAYERLSVKQDS